MLKALIAPVTDLLDKFIPDADTKMQLAQELATMAEKHAHELATAQVELNKQEAAHKSLFVAGWRPFVGWTCGVALAFNYVGLPLLDYAAHLYDPYFKSPAPLELDTMLPVLMGMLGLGGLRTIEKTRKVAREK